MSFILRDLKYAGRLLLRSPGFTSTAVMSLAIGIGASTAVFSVVHAVLLRSLPFEEPRQVMALKNALLTFSGPPSYTNILDWKESLQTFSELAAYSSANLGANLTDRAQPERIESVEVTADFFKILGVTAFRGRVFGKGDDQPGKNAVVVISYEFWRRGFGARDDAIGQSVTLNGKLVAVVGVLPPGVEFPDKCDLWIPLAFGTDRVLTGQPGYQVIGRLRNGVDRNQAQADINLMLRKLSQDQPGLWVAQRGIQVIPLPDQLVSGSRASLLILAGVVALVLLIACSNVANLFLARAAGRTKEVAIRVALGAGRMAVMRQLLVESLILSFTGGGLGLIIGSWMLKILIALTPTTIPRIREAGLNTEVLLFAVVVSVVTASVVGLAPVAQALQVDINESLKEGALRSSAGANKASLRSTLVISEIVLTVVIVTAACLLLKSLIQIQKVDPGFKPESVLTLNISLPQTQYQGTEQKTEFFRELISRIRGIPGALSVGAINYLPISKANTMLGLYEVEGQITSGSFESRLAAYLVSTPDYLNAMGIPLIQGRYLSEQDSSNSLPVVLIDQSIARSHWPNDSPIGKRLKLAGESTPREIVGVVGTVQQLGLDVDTPKQVYLTYRQSALDLRTIVVRTSSDPLNLLPAIRDQVRALDKNLPVYDIATMPQRLAGATAQRRFVILLLSIFAGAALILAAVGVYGVMAYSVAQRTHEIGIRMSLGAQQRDVFKLILGKSVQFALTGIAIGVGASLALTRLLSSMLFGVGPFDLATLFVVSAGTLAVILLASYLPALRATRVDPIRALRSE